MNLKIRDIAWAIVSENAEEWNSEYRSELGLDEETVDLLYANRCYDLANRIAGKPVPLDEIMILLDRFWARANEHAKTEDFRERVRSIVSRYDEIIFESGDEPRQKVVMRKEPKRHTIPKMPKKSQAKKAKEETGECYGHGTSVEIVTPFVLRLSILDGDNCVRKILLDPVQARKLMGNLETALGVYESRYGDIASEDNSSSESSAG